MNPSAPMLPVRAVRFCFGLAALGLLAMVVGWYQAAGRLRVEDQVSWAVLSVAGTTAVGLVTVLLVLAERRAVEQRLRGVLDSVAERHGSTAERAVASDTAAALVATDDMGRYHRPSCRLTHGKPVRASERAAHEAAGRRPCGICLRGTPPDPRGRP
jgi:hypothetical protein